MQAFRLLPLLGCVIVAGCVAPEGDFSMDYEPFPVEETIAPDESARFTADDMMFLAHCGKYESMMREIAETDRGLFESVRDSVKYNYMGFDFDCETLIENRWDECYAEAMPSKWVC